MVQEHFVRILTNYVNVLLEKTFRDFLASVIPSANPLRASKGSKELTAFYSDLLAYASQQQRTTSVRDRINDTLKKHTFWLPAMTASTSAGQSYSSLTMDEIEAGDMEQAIAFVLCLAANELGSVGTIQALRGALRHEIVKFLITPYVPKSPGTRWNVWQAQKANPSQSCSRWRCE
ncbi:hypothetical protein M427DRAFT_50996 [Gonapodya prolifera JEL478]|uniref:Uncharacterized protein n=1 Tax=Gonapodya prolifera (strain JEL478) TaxID=1344416 RepID=A0A139AXU9_GONPJ|nr:hypothetical protein M427DRAFT_50996 [Gonapodya prolifera JEL478]|eukprot:KXS21572.1 hypothetical protein M427DRAFT_50996 [Gonapodya prolifera JEL478]